MTVASVHDSQVFDELRDHTGDEDGNKRPLYADSTYRSEAQEQRLADAGSSPSLRERHAASP